MTMCAYRVTIIALFAAGPAGAGVGAAAYVLVLRRRALLEFLRAHDQGSRTPIGQFHSSLQHTARGGQYPACLD